MTGRRVLFSAQKNEGPFILEWVAFHKVIGFTDIVVVSNDCDDNSDRLLDALDTAGELTHIIQTVPVGAAPQKAAAEYVANKNVFKNGDWVMWLDLDEFLLVNSEDHQLESLIERIGNVDAVSIAWRFFGDSGVNSWPGRQIAPEFHRAEKRNRQKSPQVKTLFRYDERISRLDIHRPRLADGVGSDDFDWISSSGEKVDPAFFETGRRNLFNRITDGSRFYRLGQIMHFCTRTPDMFEKMAKRGDGYFPSDNNPVVRDEQFYERKNLNEVTELSALSMERPTVEYMAKLLENNEIYDACNSIDGFKWKPL